MEWYPSLFLKFFRQLIFPCRHMCSLETLGTIPTSRLVFVENVILITTFFGLADSALPGSWCGPISLLPGIGVIGAMSHTVGNYIISYIAFLSNSGVVLYLCAFQTLSIHSLNWMVAIFQ